VDIDLTVSQLHLGAVATTGPYLQIENGAKLTVTDVFTIGTASATSAYTSYLYINGGSTFEIGPNCAATIYYSGSYNIRTNVADGLDNYFVNKGTITVLGNGGNTVGNNVYIGYDSSYLLHVDNWGTWDASALQVTLVFEELISFNIYAGSSFKGGYITDTERAIQWTDTNVIFQDGAGGDATGAGAVTFEGAVEFYSSNSQSYDDYDLTSPPYSVIFNTTNVNVTNAHFVASNILFLYDGWLFNCNVTYYALLNSTASGVHAYFIGDNNVDGSVFAGVGTDFIVQVETGASVKMTGTFALTGSVTLINNGNWIFSSNSELYWDADAYWVNLGLMEVINNSNDYIKGTYFPGLTTRSEVGTLVNMGTIDFKNNGGLNFYQSSGKVRQCKNGIIKFAFDDTGVPGTVTLPDIALDGYVGVYYGGNVKPYSSGQQIFTWVKPAGEVPSGSVSVSSKGPEADLIDSVFIVCFSKNNEATVYEITKDLLICPGSDTQILTPIVGGACTDVPDTITSLADKASCPASAGCGTSTGKPGSGGGSPSPAIVNAASLVFLVSLICLLLKF